MKKLPLLASTLLAATALATPAFADDLTWSGGDGSWTGENVWSGSTWSDNSDAIFGSGTGTVTVTGEVTAGSVTIESGGSYTFNIGAEATLTTGTLTNSGSLALTGSGKIVTEMGGVGTLFTVDASGFSGEIYFAKGSIDAVSSVYTSSTTLVLTATTDGTVAGDVADTAEVSIQLSNAGQNSNTEFAANLVITGEGDVVIRTNDSTKTITFTGSVTGETGALQINGGGNAIFAGTVNIAQYINFQGSTTFSGETTIGTLEFGRDTTNSSSVTFTHDASVGAITTEAAPTDFTDQLTVSNNATLTVGSITLGAETIEVTASEGTMIVTGNISVSTGKLSIGEGSTLTATGATGTTIQGIAGAGTLVLESSETGKQFTVTTDSSFTGTVNVAEGQLLISGTSIASGASLVLKAAGTASTDSSSTYYTDTALVSITYGGTGVTLDHDITLVGEGGVIIRTQSGQNTGEISGNITGTDASYLQLNGTGSLTISGTVTLENGGYLNYQGSTTFTNAVKLGTLEITQDSTTTSKVTFSGENAQATAGTLTFENHGSGDASTEGLTVKNGAKLTITDALAINHDITITLDAGTLNVNGEVTGDKSANITISNGGQLSVGSGVELNVATMEIILGIDNVGSTVSPDSLAVTLDASGIYALTGGGSITTSDAAIKITIDDALAELLAEGGEYTLYIYDSQLSGLSEETFDLSELEKYGYSWNNDGQLIVGGLPEPSMFGVFFGLGAIGLVATRRRRRA